MHNVRFRVLISGLMVRRRAVSKAAINSIMITFSQWGGFLEPQQIAGLVKRDLWGGALLTIKDSGSTELRNSRTVKQLLLWR